MRQEDRLYLEKMISGYGVSAVMRAIGEISGREAELTAKRDASLAKRWDALARSTALLADVMVMT